MPTDLSVTKPTKQPGNPGWATDVSTRLEPTLGQKQSGWTDGQRPPFNLINWLFGFLGEWTKYSEDATDELDADKLSRHGLNAFDGDIKPDADGTRSLGSLILKLSTVFTNLVKFSAAAHLDAGFLVFDATGDIKSTPRVNTLNSRNQPKAWGAVSTDGAGNATLNDGFNCAVAAPTIGGSPNAVTVAFANNFANTNYAVLLTNVGTGQEFWCVASKAVGSFAVRQFQSDTGAHVDVAATATKFDFVVFGVQ